MSQKTKNERLTEEMPGTSIGNIPNGLERKECGDIGDKRAHNFKNLTNQKFGKFIVLEFIGKLKDKRPIWKCKCSECGKIHITNSRSLINNSVTTCECEATLDILNKRFGKLTVLDYSHTKGPNKYYWCVCDCGIVITTIRSSLLNDRTKSCGCHRRKKMTTHHMCFSPEYSTWSGMIQRCDNPNSSGYSDYGGRGIKVCGKWHKFENFYKDMGKRPDKMTLHRVNNNGNYNKRNCIWATSEIQSKYKRNTNWISFNKKTMILKDWAKEYNIDYKTLCARYYTCKWDFEKCLLTPIDLPKTIILNNEEKTIREWCIIKNISENTVRSRLRLGWSFENAISIPIRKK